MINLITAPPGVGKTQFAVNEIAKIVKQNKDNLVKSIEYYQYNLKIIDSSIDKKITVDLIEFKGNQELFVNIRNVLADYDNKEITVYDFFQLFDDYNFNIFLTNRVDPQHFYLATVFNLLANFVNKEISLGLKNIPPVRQIYSDINGLRIDDVLPSPDDWRTCPDGSVIFYDEVQNRQIYKNTREKNDIVGDLTVHRHRGFDIWFITQFPTLIHTELRAVVGQHYHLYRPWGLPQAWVNVWSYAVVDPNSGSKKKVAERTFRFSYSKDLYKLYTSSTMHTHKIQLPKKLFLLLGVMGIGFYFIYDGISGGTIANKKQSNALETAQNSAILNNNNVPAANPLTSPMTPEIKEKVSNCMKQFNWTEEQCREGHDPAYLKASQDSRTVNSDFDYDPNNPFDSNLKVSYEPTSKPQFSGCAKINGKYKAFTQQGTLLEGVSSDDCRKVIDKGERPFNYFAKENSTVQPSTSSSQSSDASLDSVKPKYTVIDGSVYLLVEEPREISGTVTQAHNLSL